MKLSNFRATLLLVAGVASVRAQKQDPPNINGRGQNARVDDGSTLSIHQATRQSGRQRPAGLNLDMVEERLDSIVLLVTRMSERMVAIQTNQNQQNERIENINYRITKLDLQGLEQKGQFSEVWNSLRHRMEVSERELQSVSTTLDDIKTDISVINTNSIEIKTNVANRLNEGSRYDPGGRSGPKLQAVLAAVFGVKATAQAIQASLSSMAGNITSLANNTKKFEASTGSLVSKEDLHLGLADMKEGMDNVLPFMHYQPMEKENRKGKGESTDCWELHHKRGKTKSGVYRIRPRLSPRSFFVYCDMETDGGGWTVIQRREDGTQDFKRGWKDYKVGFGNIAGEFWMGNEKIYQITNENVNELRINLGDFSQTTVRASYKAFAIGPESEGYALRLLSTYSGDAGDSLSYHVGQKWSTFDLDNDAWPDQNCARDHTGAWWYRACDTSNLNGMYLHGPVPPGDEYKGAYWYDFHGPQYSLWQTTMMIRRGGYVTRRNATVPAHVKHGPNIPHPLEGAVNPDEPYHAYQY